MGDFSQNPLPESTPTLEELNARLVAQEQLIALQTQQLSQLQLKLGVTKPRRFSSPLNFLKRVGRFASAGFVSLLLISIFSTAALASIPASDGLITGCYDSKGSDRGELRIIDAVKTTCKKGETPISWNQKGLKGDPGTPGPKGDKGDTGSQGIPGVAGAVVPKGDIGPAGVKGDKGDPGITGVSGYQIVSSLTDFTISGSKFLGVSCPDGKKVLGGGAFPFPSLADPTRQTALVALLVSSPNDTVSGWYAEAVTIGSYSYAWDLTVYAICGNVTKKTVSAIVSCR